MDRSFGVRKRGIFDVGVFNGMKRQGNLRKRKPIGLLGEKGVEAFDEGRTRWGAGANRDSSSFE